MIAKRLLVLATFASFVSGSAEAWVHGSSAPTPTGRSVQNVAKTDFLGANGVDWLRSGGWDFAGAGNPTDISKLDDAGYLVAAPTSATNYSTAGGPGSPTVGATYRWVWDAGITGKYIVSSSLSSCVAVNASVSGCTGTTATVAFSNGQAGSLTWTNGSGSPFILQAQTDGVFAHPVGTKMALYRLSDEARYQAGIYSSPEFDSLITGTGASWIRPMGAVQVGNSGENNETVWRNRIRPTDFSWNVKIPFGAIPSAGGSCGAAKICGTNTFTADASPDVSGSVWNDGDVIVAVFQNTNTGASTVTVASRPAVPIFNTQGTRITTASTFPTNAYATLTYNATLGGVLYNIRQPNTSIPIEARVQYANRFNMNLWDTIPAWALDDYASQQFTYVKANLNPWLKYGPEYYNEMWNPGFVQNLWAINMTYAYGFQLGNGSQWQYVGLRIRQLWEMAVSKFGPIGKAAYQPQPIFAFQIGAQDGSVQTWGFGGKSLVNNYTVQTTATFTAGTPCQVVWPFNGWGSSKVQISFTSTGSLPTGITPGQLYYVVNNTNNNSSSSPVNLATTEGGSAIACSGTPTGTATGTYINTTYNALVGQDYSTKPNRPIDFVMMTAGAPYLGGQNMCNIADAGCDAAHYPNNTIPATAASFWQSMISNWEGGNTSAALDQIDYDYRYGRLAGTIQNVTASGTTFSTPAAHGFSVGTYVAFEVTGGTMYSGIAPLTVYYVSATSSTSCPGAVVCNFTIRPLIGGLVGGSTIDSGSAGSGTVTVGSVKYNNLLSLSGSWMSFAQARAANYNGDRPTGYDDLVNAQYEGAAEIQGLVLAQCTSLGIVATDCVGSSGAAVLAYKNDNRAKQLQVDYYNCALGLFANCPMMYGQATTARLPSSLVLYGSSIWATAPSLTGTPYKFYDGIRQFNQN
jgi:hypothetical protein